jgi:ATP-dependent DNA helicase DinG
MRPQQVAIAERILAAIDSGESLICEAGTGTGKSFAYLAPALLSGRRVIVSTGTKHLQDQLYDRDLPLLNAAIGGGRRIALLKGRANYLCLHRLRQAQSGALGLNRDALAAVTRLADWAQRTETGDLSGAADLPEESPYRPWVTSTAENCLGAACADYDRCFVFEARRRAQTADITVVNHHLLLADLALRQRGYGELLPSAEMIVFDEAHQLPELASEFFSRSLSAGQWNELLGDCRAAWLTEAADVPDLQRLLDEAARGVGELRAALGPTDGVFTRDAMLANSAAGAAFDTLLQRGGAIQHWLENLAERGKQLESCWRRVCELNELLSDFHAAAARDCVHWVELRGRSFRLHQTPLDVAQRFPAGLAEFGCPCIYTSATLSVNGDFTHFAARLGLGDVPTAYWPSPFAYARQALLYLPEGLPDPREPGYTALAVERAVPLIRLAGGRTFFLFTSHRALAAAAPLVRAALDYPVFVQGERPRTELLEAFRASGNGVLLGTASFWEGVDVRGRALGCVIIDKLPFAPPDDPVLQARLRRMEEEGRSPFPEFQLPEAVIALRQGVGRLIRDAADSGVVMICDPRLVQKPYGKIFLRSLPDMPRTRSLEEVAAFLAAHAARDTATAVA